LSECYPLKKSRYACADRTFIVVTSQPNQPYENPAPADPTVPLPPGGAPAAPPPPGYAPAGYPPPGYGYQQPMFDQYGRPLSDKSKVVAGVLQLVLGGFGVGRFYIGDNRTAVFQLIVTLITCGLGHIWGMIDGILILVNGGVDAQGRVLRD
jgi:TM2 domain-containing membrane protein YozV